VEMGDVVPISMYSGCLVDTTTQGQAGFNMGGSGGKLHHGKHSPSRLVLPPW
jgi:hypothetical protein